jgi:hypothetical protein
MTRQGMNTRDGRLRRLGHAVNEYLAAGGKLERSKSSLCAELWPQVVGPWYAGHSRVISLRGKELSVCCDTPSLAQQLQSDQETVAARLNERLGGKFVGSLRAASVGPSRRRDRLSFVAEEASGPTEEELAQLPLSEEDQQFCRKVSAKIVSPDLRERYRLLVEGQLRLGYWKTARGYRSCEGCGALHDEVAEDCFSCRLARQEPPRKGGA